MGAFSVLLPVFLGLGVVLVNGFTDAPNAIATAVCAKAISLRSACLLCGIFNLFGAFLFSVLSGQVIDTVFSIISLKNQSDAYICIISGLSTTILFGLIAWIFKMPSSESHALLCSLLGASFFFGGAGGIFVKCGYIIICMIFSCLLSFFLSFIIGLYVSRKSKVGNRYLVCSLCMVSLMHGAQDGQKFVGALMFLSGFADTSSAFFGKLPLCLLVSIFMMLGSLLGGKRIIDTLGNKTTKLNNHSALASDASSILTMLICSIFGLPVSTGNIRAFSIIGGGVSIKQPVNKKTAGSVFLTSILTLPICFLLGYFIAFLISAK